MHMTFERIPAEDHPAIRAVKTIKQLHVDTIAMIDNGMVCTKTDDDGVTRDVAQEIKAACQEQIMICDEIIETGRVVRPELLEKVELMILDAQVTIEEKLKEATSSDLPEIGNYDHGKPN